MSALFDDPPLIKDDNLVSAGDGREAVDNDERGAPLQQPPRDGGVISRPYSSSQSKKGRSENSLPSKRCSGLLWGV